jgi:hypothetical protein
MWVAAPRRCINDSSNVGPARTAALQATTPSSMRTHDTKAKIATRRFSTKTVHLVAAENTTPTPVPSPLASGAAEIGGSPAI